MSLRLLGLVLAVGLVAVGSGGAATAPREILFEASPGAAMAIRSDGTGLRRVAFGGTPAWSPDGTSVVYASSPTRGLAIVPAQGGQPRSITNGLDLSPSWSPDGAWIAFLRSEGYPPSLYVVRPDGTDLHKLVDSYTADTPAWSPHSRYLLVGSKAGLETLDVAGHARVIANTQRGSVGSWSPNGRWIVFVTPRRHHDGLALVRANGSGFRWLAPPRAGSDAVEPAWAPDSKRLAYMSSRQIGSLAHSEIRIVSIGGTKLGGLRSSPDSHDEYPQWSPDGRQIVFDRDAAIEPVGETASLLVGNPKSGHVRELYRYVERGTESWRPQ